MIVKLAGPEAKPGAIVRGGASEILANWLSLDVTIRGGVVTHLSHPVFRLLENPSWCISAILVAGREFTMVELAEKFRS